MSILMAFGLKRTENDEKTMQIIKNTYKTACVVGRGTLKISGSEVINSDGFKRAHEKAKRIVLSAS